MIEIYTYGYILSVINLTSGYKLRPLSNTNTFFTHLYLPGGNSFRHYYKSPKHRQLSLTFTYYLSRIPTCLTIVLLLWCIHYYSILLSTMGFSLSSKTSTTISGKKPVIVTSIKATFKSSYVYTSSNKLEQVPNLTGSDNYK